MPEQPDFDALYAHHPLAPRMAARLWVVSQIAHDHFREGIAEMWLEQLPRVATPYVDEEFIAAFGSRFEVLAMRLGAGQVSEVELTTCTADEMALHLVIDHAEALYQDDAFGAEWIEGLPRREGDDDFFVLKDLLFADLDIEVLFNPAMDGAEDPESEAALTEGYANLHPRDWFKAFER